MNRLTHSSWSDGIACNSFLQLQFRCSGEQSAALICSFSCQHPCLTAGLCTQNRFLWLEAPPNSNNSTIYWILQIREIKFFIFFFLVTEVWETQVTVLKIYMMIYLLVLLAKKRHDSKCSLTILLMDAHKYMNGLLLPSLLSSDHTASSQSIAPWSAPAVADSD